MRTCKKEKGTRGGGDMEGAERDGVTVFRGGEQWDDRAGNVEWLSEGMCCAMG